MKSYQADELDEKTVYKLLSGSIVPRPIAWVTSQNSDGLVNVAPFSFFNVASANPPLLSISFTGNKDSLN
ncbi:flavin reductase family protein, partial [Streptococcus thermophilus]|nr:flavin reductase family protein [Streptococcus thermophilus]